MRTSLLSPANLLTFSGVVTAFHLGKVAPAIPTLQGSLGLTMVQAGFLLSLMQFSGASIGAILGTLSDTIGPRRSILIGHALLSLASILGVVIPGPEELLLFRILESLGFLMVVLPTPGLLLQFVPQERLALRLGLWGAYMPFGTATAFLIGPIVINAIGWRGWWLLPACCSLACIALIRFALPAKSSTRSPAASPPTLPLARRLGRVLKSRNTWFLGIAYSMYSGQWIAVIGFLPTIYAEAGMPATLAGVLTATVALVNIAGNVTAGVLVHKGIRKQTILLIGYLCLAVMTLIAFSQMTHAMPTLRYATILLFSGVGGVIPATLFILVVKSAPTDELIATSVGWVQQLSSLGMLLMPPLMATLAGWAGGWHWTWLVSGTAAIVGLALVAPISRGK